MDLTLGLVIAKGIAQILLLNYRMYWAISVLDLCAFYVLTQAPIVPFLIVDEDPEWKEL